MSDLLAIGASGVRAYQIALGTVSENIANVGATGYSRRTTDMSEVLAVSGGLTARTVNAAEGAGVRVDGITRIADQYRAAEVRNSGADLARTQAGVTWLDRIETSLSGNQLGSSMTSFFTAATAVAADPTATTPRAQMLTAATGVASAFTSTGASLDQIESDLDGTAEDAVDQLNGLADALSKINAGLSRVQQNTSGAGALADQRDQILEQMSAISDVSVTTDALGRATVNLAGATGPTLVQGVSAGTVTYARGTTGAVSFAVHYDGTTQALTSAGGALAGIADGASRLAGAKDSLKQLAASFVADINTVQTQGRDLDGNAGQPLFATGTGTAQVTLALTDPRGIAAAAIGEGTRGNGNLAALAAQRTSGGYEATLSDLVADNAEALSQRNRVADAQTTIRDNAVSARDAVSAVNLDTEAVDLMRFQQAYSASARVIQAARDTFQSILEIR